MIFKHVSSTQGLYLNTVCIKWLEIIENFFPKYCIALSKDLDFSRSGRLYQTFSGRLRSLKEKRTFPHLRIKSFPNALLDMVKLTRFIDLIASEVKHLEIDTIPDLDMPNDWFNNKLYWKMPNLKSLHVGQMALLGDLTFPKGLEKINVWHLAAKDLIQVKIIQNKNLVKEFTCDLKFSNESRESLRSFISNELIDLLDKMKGVEDDMSVGIGSNYNFCNELKMVPDDVYELDFWDGINSLTPIVEFKNLKVVSHSRNRLSHIHSLVCFLPLYFF